MRHKISWSELKGARVGVWGLGVEGRVSLRRLALLGAEVVLVDDRPPADEVDGHQVLALSGPGREALQGCQVVVKAPGVSRYRPEVEALEARGIPVVGGLGLWLEEADLSRVACVTGTKGKSTTVALCGHLLSGLGVDAFVGGNLGRPPYDPDVGEHRLWVVETSSFQATDLASSPEVVAVTSLAPDHLDWHGDVETYYRDKLSAASQPGAKVTVAGTESAALMERAELLGPATTWVGGPGGPEDHWVEALGLPAPTHRLDATVARAVLEALGVAGAGDPGALAEAARGFRGLPSRLEDLGRLGGVSFVDDSLSTNALSAVAAVNAFPGRRLAVILGGQDRGVDYGPLCDTLLGRDAPTLAVTLPGAGRRIASQLERRGAGRREAGGVAPVGGMEEAVRAALSFAAPDGVVLLSPAAPSFGQFRDYRERSEVFRRAMAACSPAPA